MGDGNHDDLEALLGEAPSTRRSCAVCDANAEIKDAIELYRRMKAEGRTQWSIRRLFEKALKPMNPGFRTDVLYRHLNEEHGADES